MDLYPAIMSGQADTLASHRRPPLLRSSGAVQKSKIMAGKMDKGLGSGHPKLCRQKSSSQPKLAVDGALRRGSLDTFLLDGRARSNSLAKLTDLKRNLSASNLAALSDSNLSLKEAEPVRSYDKPNTSGSLSKRYLEQLIKRYYYQLTEGCGKENCTNRFCKSYKQAVKLSPDIAAIISIQLASSQRLYFCTSEKYIGRALPESVFQTKNNRVKSFLQSLYSCTPFSTLFEDAVPVESPRATNIDGIHRSTRQPNGDCRNRTELDHLRSRLEDTDAARAQLSVNKLAARRLMRKPPTGKLQSSSTTSLPYSHSRQIHADGGRVGGGRGGEREGGGERRGPVTSRAGSTPSLVSQRGCERGSNPSLENHRGEGGEGVGQRRGSTPALVARRAGSIGKLAARERREAARRGENGSWGSDNSLPTGDAANLPWDDQVQGLHRQGHVSGSGDDVTRNLSRSNSSLLRSRGISMNSEGGLHNRSLSSSQGNLSLGGSCDNLVNMHYRTRTSPASSASNSLLQSSGRSGGSGLSFTSGATPSSLSSNPMSSISPLASPIASPTYSPAPSTVSSQELSPFTSPNFTPRNNYSPTHSPPPSPAFSPAFSPAPSPAFSPAFSPAPRNNYSPAFSPAASSTFSSQFSPAPSPLRLLSDREALEETDDVREFERSLSLELAGLALDAGREFALTHLTLDMLQSIIDQYNECGDDSFLLNTIRTVFMSDTALNESFKVDEGNPSSAVDLSAVRAAYNLLWSLHPRDRFVTALANTLEILLMRLDNMYIQPHQTNQILIILECPLLEVNFELVQILCRILAKRLVPNARTSLVQGLAQLKKDRFQRLLGILKTNMASMIRPKQGASEGMIHVATVLDILYDANQVTCQQGPINAPASLSDFYCPQLSRDLDYQAEYHRWQHRASLFRKAPRDECSNDVQDSLLDFPFLLDPASKVHVLHLDAVVQMRKEYQMAILHQARVNQAQKYLKDGRRFTSNLKDSIKAAMCPFLVLEIRRDFLISDTLAQIRLKKNDLKKPLKIKYIGGGEQGLDMGGLQKEFFQLISEAVFNPSYGMFVSSEENRTIWINGSSSSSDSDDEFELVGTLLGLAIYNGIILDVSFPMALYRKLHGHTVTLDDLVGVQPSLGRGIREMLVYEGDDVEDIFCQTFQVSYTSMGEVLTVDLVPNGSRIPVTNKNCEEYANMYVQYLLNLSIARQFEAFARGFHSVCGGSALQLFQPSEIELLICGNPELDFQALEASATYEDGFSRKHQTVLALWRTVHSLDEERKKKLLHFITGSDRVPLKGLSSLPIVIQRNGPDSERLPTAMTCFNRLLLPEYKDEKRLRERLLLAIQYGKGFGLT